MLKVTSQQLTDAVGNGFSEVGRPFALGSVKDGNTLQADRQVLEPIPKGYVLLATHFSVSTGGAASVAGNPGTTKDALQASPSSGQGGGSGVGGMRIQHTGGTDAVELFFKRFARFATLFGNAAAPDWRTAPPGNLATWSPKYPVVLPSGFQVRPNNATYYSGVAANSYAEYPGGQAVSGLLVSEDDARMLGFGIASGKGAGSYSAADRTQLVASSQGNGSAEDLAAGRTGKSIRILDINLRLQARTNAATTVELRQKGDSRTICKFVTSNPAELIDKSWSPDIFLKGGETLELVTNVSGSCSIIVSYEYVNDDEIPGDHFWGSQVPHVPTPTEGTVGVDSVFCTNAIPLTLYYPRLDTLGETATKTAAGKGRQHFIRGYTISAQKAGSIGGSSDDVDQQLFCITAAGPDSTLPAFRNTSVAINHTGDVSEGGANAVTPTIALVNHDQNVTECQGGLNVPTQDNGSLRVDTINMSDTPNTILGVATTPTDGHITEWYVSVWGRTIPTRATSVRRST
jgi:hypothetical protein